MSFAQESIMKVRSMTRRDFVRLSAGAVAAGAVMKGTLLEPVALAAQTPAGGRKIRFASIGTGIRGCDILRAAREVPTGELVATADLYDMHQKAGIEAYGKEVPSTKDYRTLLDRKDIDAVIIATSDHLHRHLVVEACAAGKDVYCEKPMSHNVADGLAMVEAVRSNKRIFECGSQRVSSILFKKAAEIYASGRLGEVHHIEAFTDRNSPSGAWVYPVPHDASPKTIDWDSFLKDAPQRPFDAERFFRWRCFADYGEGLTGDLFVHLLSGMQAITGINAIPDRAYSTGSLTHFNDGRDYPDFMTTLYDYPGLTFSVHCNQNTEPGEQTIFHGKEATMTLVGDSVIVTPQDTRPEPEGYSLDGWTAAAKRQYLDEWYASHPAQPPTVEKVESYSVGRGYDETVDHLANFFRAIETREHVVEDEVFGNNTATACHMGNHSYFHKTIATWDAASKTIKG
jgi:predicted dehydrogenase